MSSTVKLDIRVYPIEEPKGATVAFANVGIDDMLAISGIRVVNGEKGAFVSMPQTQDKNGEYHNVAAPVNDDLRKELNKAVLAEYKAVMSGHGLEQSVDAKIKGERENSLDVKVFPLKDPKGATMAFADITVDNLVAINGARVVSGEKGDFVAMPQSKDKDGNFHDIAFPITAELRKELNSAILDEYYKAVERSADRGSSFSERLAEGAQKSAQYTKAAGAVAKSAPGLGD
jgi:DNA-binding cell septation regulator SpoVG